MSTLYHFTCAHGYKRIGRFNCMLIPQGPHPLLNWAWLIWLTTELLPDQETTGLGRVRTTCDRMAYRYVVTDTSGCRAWLGSPERAATPAVNLHNLESFGDPEHWWITSQPVRAVWDRSYAKSERSDPMNRLRGAPRSGGLTP